MESAYKVCPECGGEFVPEMEVCPDCGETLRWSREVDAWDQPTLVGGLEPLEPSPELALVRADELGLIEALASRLVERGIRSLVHTSPTPDAAAHEESLAANELGRYRHFLFVRREDLGAAVEVDREVLLEEVPELAAAGDFTQPDLFTCPSCGSRWPEGTPECPGCGLGFELDDVEEA